jgi:hypothetical protein
MRSGLVVVVALVCAAAPVRASGTDEELDDVPRGIWCAKTETLLPQVDARGGVLVRRALLSDGRMIATYENEDEQLVLEHGADGVSCFVALRARRNAR